MSQGELRLFREPRDTVPAHVPVAAIEALDRAFDAVPIGGPLTAETLRDALSYEVREILRVSPNAVGGYIQQKVRAKQITHDGWTECQRDAARGRALRRWRRVA